MIGGALSILSKIDLKTGIGLAVILTLGAWLTLEKIRHGDTKDMLSDSRQEYAREFAGRLQAEAVAHEWQVTAQRCNAEVKALRHIAKDEQEALQRRIERLKKELSELPVIEVPEGEYSAQDLRRDVTRWGI